jgi:hypothetical protein
MKRIIIATYVIFHLLCGYTSAALLTADFQGRFPDVDDCRETMGGSLLMGVVLGPMALTMEWFLSGFAEHGIMWTCPPAAKETR